jgi:limonene-1,2-epoxide hydrolase
MIERRGFIGGLGASLVALGGVAPAAAAELTAGEQANVKIVHDFIAARVKLRNAHVSLEEWKRTMAQYAIEDLMFSVHAPGKFVAQAKIPEGLGPFKHIEMDIKETYAKGPIVVHERVDKMSFENRPDSEGRFVGVFALKDGKIVEWIEYSY